MGSTLPVAAERRQLADPPTLPHGADRGAGLHYEQGQFTMKLSLNGVGGWAVLRGRLELFDVVGPAAGGARP